MEGEIEAIAVPPRQINAQYVRRDLRDITRRRRENKIDLFVQLCRRQLFAVQLHTDEFGQIPDFLGKGKFVATGDNRNGHGSKPRQISHRSFIFAHIDRLIRNPLLFEEFLRTQT